MTRLGDVCEKIGSGATPRGGKEAYKDAGIPIIRSQNIHDWVFQPDGLAFLDDEQAESLSNVEVRSNDVLLNITGDSVARACIVPSERIPARVNQHVAIVRAGKEINPTYLLASLQSKKTTLLSLASSGATRNALTKRMIENLDIDLPSREIQDSIAQVLDSIQYKITLNNRLNDYLLELATSLFDERIKDSFEYTTVREYVKYMSNGSTPSRKNSSYWDDGTIPWIKTGEVNNKLIFDTSEHITKHALEKTSVHLLPKDTVIMALYGSGTAGRLALLQSPATTNQACTAMICESSSEAFYLFVVLKKMYHEIDNLTRGSVQQNLSKEIVANLRVPNVKKDILDSLGFNVIYSQIAFSEAETLNLTKLRDALLPRLMSGEIDVSKVDLTQLTNNHLADC